MPIELGIWKINDSLEKITFSNIETELKLEETITKDISIIDPTLMIIGRQIITSFGKIIDILVINSEGNLSIIELKRNKTPREVVAQVLDYASWIQGLSYNDIVQIYYEKNQGEPFEQAFFEKFHAD
jgi:RecB family endonuclease NucS